MAHFGHQTEIFFFSKEHHNDLFSLSIIIKTIYSVNTVLFCSNPTFSAAKGLGHFLGIQSTTTSSWYKSIQSKAICQTTNSHNSSTILTTPANTSILVCICFFKQLKLTRRDKNTHSRRNIKSNKKVVCNASWPATSLCAPCLGCQMQLMRISLYP